MPLATRRGGAEQTLLQLLRHHDRTGLDWTILFFEDGPLVDQCRALGLDVAVVPNGRLSNPWQFARCLRRLIHLIRERKIDLVLSWMKKAHFYGGLAALWTGRPALWFQHTFPADVHWTDRLATLVPARGILVCSQSGADLQNQLPPARPTAVVHPGVDLQQFDRTRLPSKATLRRRFELPQNAPVIGMVGRLQHWKGMHVFIDAVAHLRSHYPTLRGVIVGGRHDHEPEYPSRLRRQIQRLGLSDAIMLTGFHPDPAAWMSTFDVFVHASDREPFGLVVIEAMALGLPVVASDTAGPTEVITAEKNGLLAPFGDSATLAAQIQRYLTAPDWAQTIGRAARARTQDFTVPAFVNRVVEAVHTLAAPDSAPPFSSSVCTSDACAHSPRQPFAY